MERATAAAAAKAPWAAGWRGRRWRLPVWHHVRGGRRRGKTAVRGREPPKRDVRVNGGPREARGGGGVRRAWGEQYQNRVGGATGVVSAGGGGGCGTNICTRPAGGRRPNLCGRKNSSTAAGHAASVVQKTTHIRRPPIDDTRGAQAQITTKKVTPHHRKCKIWPHAHLTTAPPPPPHVDSLNASTNSPYSSPTLNALASCSTTDGGVVDE